MLRMNACIITSHPGCCHPAARGWPQMQTQPQTPPEGYAVVRGGSGYRSFNNTIHWVDSSGLTDSFLARLPAANPSVSYDYLRSHWTQPRLYQLLGFQAKAESTRYNWRIGHHTRAVPEGYMEFLAGEVTALPDARLNALLQDVTLVAKGDKLFSTARLAAIWRLNTGYHGE